MSVAIVRPRLFERCRDFFWLYKSAGLALNRLGSRSRLFTEGPLPQRHLNRGQMKLKELAAGQSLSGIDPTDVVSVVALVPLAEGAVQLIYRGPDGAMKERLLGRAEESTIAIAATERPVLIRRRRLSACVRGQAHRPRFLIRSDDGHA